MFFFLLVVLRLQCRFAIYQIQMLLQIRLLVYQSRNNAGWTMLKLAYSLALTIKFESELQPAVNAFKAARLFLPSKINDLNPNAAAVEPLRAFKFLDNDRIMNELKSELPTYLAIAEDVVV